MRDTKLAIEGLQSKGRAKRVQTTSATQMVGLEWRGSPKAVFEVRSLEKGRWTAWSDLEGEPAEGPDTTSKEYRGKSTAGPMWVGKAVRTIEVRLRSGRPSGVRMHAIRSEAPPQGGIAAAAADAPQPSIISRAAWGADESYRSFASGCNGNPEYAARVRYSVVHHTAHSNESNNYGPGDSAALIRGIYYFHTHTNGWCDIGYNFIVDRYGQTFEGRFGGIDRPVVGAHAAGFNSESTGVSLLGNFDEGTVPSAMYGALKSLLAWKLSIHGVNPNSQTTVTAGSGSPKYAAGTRVTLWTISGHRDVGSTSCPGSNAYAMLPGLRPAVASAVLGSSWRPAIVRAGGWYLRSTQTSGPATTSFPYGNAGDKPLMCDWDGDGSRTPGVFRGGVFYLRNQQDAGGADVTVGFGDPGDTPVCGDWDGNGTDTVGVKRGMAWFLRNSNTTGAGDLMTFYGDNTDTPVVGDWDGNGTDTVGVWRRGVWYVANDNIIPTTAGQFAYGNSDDIPIVGDWDGNGTSGPGVVRQGAWYLSDTPGAGANISFGFGDRGDVPRAWL